MGRLEVGRGAEREENWIKGSFDLNFVWSPAKSTLAKKLILI